MQHCSAVAIKKGRLSELIVGHGPTLQVTFVFVQEK